MGAITLCGSPVIPSSKDTEYEGRDEPLVAILMATYNGARYLDEQLESIVRQTHQNWLLVVSDDGSTDSTLGLIERYRERLGDKRIRLVSGPRHGFAANFISLCCDPLIEADYFAFCDQDDIWQPQHLTRALSWLQNVLPERPALHCGRTSLINEKGVPSGVSPLFSKRPAFGNALVQSIAGGNTMVFNASARRLLQRAGAVNIVSHDWWAYMLISGAGGDIYYASVPSVEYRQHGGNLIGANTGLRNRWYRIQRMIRGHFKEWNELNLAALEQSQALLEEPNRIALRRLIGARRTSLPMRCIEVIRSGVYRQTWLGNVGLAAATLMGKL